ncbi:MAG TPA: hypothetical protein VGP65_16590 [Candidatus Angelobacter sp.]|jgi:hypothetical protein|nr:hypothetical protein [Candidatus Angelobacter sp.]
MSNHRLYEQGLFVAFINLNPQIVGAIVTGLAAIIAASIGLLKRNKQRRYPYQKIALGFQFGYHSYALYFWIKLTAVHKMMRPVEGPDTATTYIKQSVNEERQKSKSLSKQLDISFSADSVIESTIEVRELPI